MKAIILTNAYLNNEVMNYQPHRIKEELERLGVEVDLRPLNFTPFYLKDGLQTTLQGYDFCVFLDKDKYALQALKKLKIPTFNPPDAIMTCDDKMETCLALSGIVPMPNTIPAPLCFLKEGVISPDEIKRIEELGYPIVVKEAYGSRGQGVYLARNREELCALMEKLKCIPHLYQEMITTSYGKDVRVLVVGGKPLGAMLRVSQGDFRSNLSAGGKGEVYPLDEQLITLSQRIAEALNLSYCGIDFLIGETGYVVCEVNSNAFFFGFEEVTSINVAEQYAQYMFNCMIKR